MLPVANRHVSRPENHSLAYKYLRPAHNSSPSTPTHQLFCLYSTSSKMRPDGPRPSIIGPDSGPEAPFPLRMKGQVVSGFGRGSKDVRYIFSTLTPIPQEDIIELTIRPPHSSVSPPQTYQLTAYPGSRRPRAVSTLAGQASSCQLHTRPSTRSLHRRRRPALPPKARSPRAGASSRW